MYCEAPLRKFPPCMPLQLNEHLPHLDKTFCAAFLSFSFLFFRFFPLSQADKREEGIPERHPSEVATGVVRLDASYGPHGRNSFPQLVANEWSQTKFTYVTGITIWRRMSAEIIKLLYAAKA